MKKLSIALFLFIFCYQTVCANDLLDANNKFGIHLAQPHFEELKAAARLVNSSGGDWGYITLVIQENDRNKNKWQEIFDILRTNHLIPIIRLATEPEGDNWRRPKKDEIDSWISFLDSLNWVVKNRYIILFNEPNHGSEWGGIVDAKDYGEVAIVFARKLKEKNPNFYIMLAGLDASAPSYGETMMDEAVFLQTIWQYKPEIINYLDGWVSHSYPNPGFSGSPWDMGRRTIRTYQWELDFLRSLGVDKNLPVFITETGWQRGGKKYLDENTVAEYFKIAFDQVWQPDDRVAAVTPFVLDYQAEPFLNFSWKKYNDSSYYSQYYTVQSIVKNKGNPQQIEKGEINFNLPKELVAQSNYQFKINLKNLGQAIWDKKDDHQLRINNDQTQSIEYSLSDLQDIKPFENQNVELNIKTKEKLGKNQVWIDLYKGDNKVVDGGRWQLSILPLPSLKFQIKLYPRFRAEGNDFQLQIFDDKENLVFKKSNVLVKNGRGVLGNIHNIVIGRKYRLVILKPYYLPRQNFIVFQKTGNQIKFSLMLPLDFNLDGKFSSGDLKTLFNKPSLLKLILF